MVRFLIRAVGLVALLGVLAACAPAGPDADTVREALQAQLDAAFGGRVLGIASLRESGGAPLSDPPGRLVYFNARLELARDYDFGDWNAHGAASLASLLGAGARGITGVAQSGNRKGDILYVFGSAAFARRGEGYALVPALPPGSVIDAAPAAAAASGIAARPHEQPTPTALESARAAMRDLETEPAGALEPVQREAILAQEYREAYVRARARLDRAAQTLILAAGPAGGAYAEVVSVLGERSRELKLPLEVLITEGSVANLRMLEAHEAQFAIAQNDIARMARHGRGRFSGVPQPGLRALASLFPEPIHVVARADRGIASIGDLAGKRVDLGLPGSGTHATALAILASAGVPASAFAEGGGRSLRDAAAALAADRIDAFFATIHAPAREITRLAASTRIAIVPLGPSRELVEMGLVPITLQPLTYPGQAAPIPTLAATAMMVTREDVPAAQVNAAMTLLFDATGAVGRRGALPQLDPRRAAEGVTIPFHPAAQSFLEARRAAPPAKR